MVKFAPSVVVPLLINALLVFLYANGLSPGEYGLLNVTLNGISIVYASSLSFLQLAAFRFYTADGLRDDERTYLSTYVFGNLGIGLVLGIVLFFVNAHLYRFDWALVVVAVVVNGLFQFSLGLSRLREDASRYSQTRIGASILGLGLFSCLIWFVPSLNHVYAVAATFAAYAVVVGIELFRERHAIRPRWFSINILRYSGSYGIPLMGVAVLGLLLAYSDQFLVLHFLTVEDAGYYALGYRLSEMAIGNVTGLILLVMTPAVMRAYDRGDSEACEFALTSTMSLCLWAVLPLCAALVLFAHPFVTYVFPQYSAAGTVVQLVSFASVLNSMSMIMCKGLELPKRTVRLLLCLLAAAAVNVLYNVAFIPRYGVNAAAHASILAYAVYNGLLWWQTNTVVRNRFDWGFIRRTLALLLVTILFALVIRSILPISGPVVLTVEVVLCVVVYLVGTKALGLLVGQMRDDSTMIRE